MTASESYLPDIEVHQPKVNRKHLFFAVLLGMSIALPLLLGYPKDAPVIPKESKIIVQAHQTLWDIEYEEYGDKADVRQAIDAIMQDNGIKQAGDLQVGQVLQLPVIQ